MRLGIMVDAKIFVRKTRFKGGKKMAAIVYIGI
jgi:hypothetical protein